MFKRQPSGKEWVKYSVTSCVLFGFTNFLIGDLATKYGIAGQFPIGLGQFLMWLAYHTCVRAHPAVYNQHRCVAGAGLLVRGANHLALIQVTFLAFEYADLAKVNQGVIAGLFTSGVVFCTVLFWLVYGEKIKLVTAAGMLIILLGVVSVGIKPTSKDDAPGESVDYTNLLIAIAYALSSGVLIATNALIMRHYVRVVGFSPLQLNIDGFMVCAVVLIACFCLTETKYRMLDIGKAILCSVTSMAATVSITTALSVGKGGPIQAIDSLKSLIPLFLHVIVNGLLPSWLQLAGVGLGIAGACVVAMAKD